MAGSFRSVRRSFGALATAGALSALLVGAPGALAATSSGPPLSVVGQPAVHGTSVAVTLRCSAPASQHCSGFINAYVTEHRNAKGKPVAVTASDGAKHHSARTRTVSVGTTNWSLVGGTTAKFTLKLNHTGKALLARFGRMVTDLNVDEDSEVGIAARVLKVTFRTAKAKKH